jgi:beta-glucanase (GH16 family)
MTAARSASRAPRRSHPGFAGLFVATWRRLRIFADGGYNRPRMAPGAGYGMTRRWIAGSAVALALLALPAAAAAASDVSPMPQAHSATKTATSILHTTVPAKGKYLLIVWVRSRTKHSRLVDVYIAGHPMKSVVANPWWGAAVYYTLNLSPTKLAVRTVNAPPAVAVRATLSLRKASPSSPSTAPTTDGSTTGATSNSSTSSSSTPSTTTTAPPPPTTTPPPTNSQFGTTPIFSDNFQQDFAQNQTEPSSTSWNLDNWGSCGGTTLSQNNTGDGGPGTTNYYIDGINPTRNAYLTSNGLAITAIPAGGDSYASAQVDGQPNANGSSNQGFSAAYGMVEASIQMPQAANGQPAQGLCPGFWMLGNNDIPGSTIPGEIDIIEAPSFGGAQGYPAYFDLHGTDVNGPTGTTSQQYSESTPAAGNLAAGFHTYSIAWTPSTITWSVDGTPYYTASQTALVAGGSWIENYDTSKFHLIFTLAVGGWPCDDPSVPCYPQTEPQNYTMYVQWVKWFPYTASS